MHSSSRSVAMPSPHWVLSLLLIFIAGIGVLGETSFQSSTAPADTVAATTAAVPSSSAAYGTTGGASPTTSAPFVPTDPDTTAASTNFTDNTTAAPATSAVGTTAPQSAAVNTTTAPSTTRPAQSTAVSTTTAPSTTRPAATTSIATTAPPTTMLNTAAPSTVKPSTAPSTTSVPAATSVPAPFVTTALAPPTTTSSSNYRRDTYSLASICVFENLESEFCVGSSINLIPSFPCFLSSKSVTVQLFYMDQASSVSPAPLSSCIADAGSPSVSITRESAHTQDSIDFLFRDDKGIAEEGFYCAYLCVQFTSEPSSCDAASADAKFAFFVTSTGCWNYNALVGSSVTLSLALLVTCIISLIIWRRRRASTSSGNRSRLPSISLPSLGRSRAARFNRLVNEAELQGVRADEQRSLIGSDGLDVDPRGPDSASGMHSGQTLVDIFGDSEPSSMSFVTNRPQVQPLFAASRVSQQPHSTHHHQLQPSLTPTIASLTRAGDPMSSGDFMGSGAQLADVCLFENGVIKVLWKIGAGSNDSGSGTVQAAEATLSIMAETLGDITQLECKVATTKGVALHLTPLTSNSISKRGGAAASSATMSVHLQWQATGRLPRVRVNVKYFFEDRTHEFTMDAPAALK